MARKKDKDVIALYVNLNGGTALGAAGRNFNAANVHAIVSNAKANKFGSQLYIVHHPNAVATLSKEAATTAGNNAEITSGWSADLLSNFYSGLRPINGVPIFEDGNIEKTGSVDSGYGVIADKTALAALTSVETRTERQRDASLRATEIVMTADYGVFELDDSKGAPIQFEIGDLSTS